MQVSSLASPTSHLPFSPSTSNSQHTQLSDMMRITFPWQIKSIFLGKCHSMAHHLFTILNPCFSGSLLFLLDSWIITVTFNELILWKRWNYTFRVSALFIEYELLNLCFFFFLLWENYCISVYDSCIPFLLIIGLWQLIGLISSSSADAKLFLVLLEDHIRLFDEENGLNFIDRTNFAFIYYFLGFVIFLILPVVWKI